MAETKPTPTDSELQILAVLWDQGPCTVRRVHAEVSARRDVGYTTVLKLMQIMLEKGLLLRDDRERSHVYRPAAPRAKTQRRLARDLIDAAFSGSSKNLVIEALGARRPSAEELADLRKLIDDMERKA